MTYDEIREMVRSEIERCAVNSRARSGQTRWCRENGVTNASLSLFLRGKGGPPADMLDALGLEWQIVRKLGTPIREESISAVKDRATFGCLF